jgi:hypothetical protein
LGLRPDKISQQPENCENRNDPDLVQAFLKKWWVESDFKISHKQMIPDGIVLAHLELKPKVFPGPLTDLSAWVGFCTSSPQQGVKYQL